MARVVTPVTRLGRTCDSENAHRYWVWQFMRQNWLSNRIFKSFDDIVDHRCYAWNTLIDQPWKIMSIARREWDTVGYSMLGLVLRQFDNLVHALYAVIHRDLKDRILFLDPQSRFFRGFIGRIRGFRLPIHLEAKSAVVRLLALRDRLRDGRRAWLWSCSLVVLSLPLNDLLR